MQNFDKKARPVPDLVSPTRSDMIQNLGQKTREVFVINSILAERMALLAPFGKDRNLNQIERGMLLAELLGLAAKFENKVRQNKQWEKFVENDSINLQTLLCLSNYM